MLKNKQKNIHRFQEKSGWCGPAVVQMILLKCNIKKNQSEIAKDIYKPWWGTTQQTILAYLSQYFKVVNYKNNARISDISFHLKKNHLLIVNWWDDIDTNQPDGHYSIVVKYDRKKGELTLLDPSKEREGIWKIKVKNFNERWYDYLDVHGSTWVEGWILWVDPKSKIKK